LKKKKKKKKGYCILYSSPLFIPIVVVFLFELILVQWYWVRWVESSLVSLLLLLSEWASLRVVGCWVKFKKDMMVQCIWWACRCFSCAFVLFCLKIKIETLWTRPWQSSKCSQSHLSESSESSPIKRDDSKNSCAAATY
jgi:hypothetical protein